MKPSTIVLGFAIFVTLFCGVSQILHPEENVKEIIWAISGVWVIYAVVIVYNKIKK